MNTNTLSKKNRGLLIYALTAVFYFWMAAQIPYTHDDWDWGLDKGMHQFLYATINSRYVGNFFEIIMTRSVFLKSLIMGTCFFLLPFSLSRIASRWGGKPANSANLFLFFLCNCLLLTMNREIWRQTYGWVAGYANYGISALFMIPWLLELLHCSDSSVKPKHDSVPKLLLYFVVCLSSQLFLENLSIYHTLFAFVICGIHFHKSRRFPIRNLVMLFSALLGLFIMFSSSLYDTLLSTGYAIGEYREIPFLNGSGPVEALYDFVVNGIRLSSSLYTSNFVLCTFIMIPLSILLGKAPIKPHKKRMILRVNLTICVLFAASFLYDAMSTTHHKAMYVFDAFLSICYFMMVLFEIFALYHNDKPQKYKLAILWCSPVIIIAPLLITTESGMRLFFTTNIYMILFCLILSKEALDLNLIPSRNAAFSALAFVMACLFLYHGYIYMHIGKTMREHEKIIETAVKNGSEQITLPAYLFSEYLHSPVPLKEHRFAYFKEFYGIPMDVEVIFEN